ncbi:hypothetical protein HanRHA438_Chr06g0286191 [Helianthus annuus]|nr:hypothetical protein HanRHA438_Chr06g0286191 [Helianthus annuus]
MSINVSTNMSISINTKRMSMNTSISVNIRGMSIDRNVNICVKHEALSMNKIYVYEYKCKQSCISVFESIKCMNMYMNMNVV